MDQFLVPSDVGSALERAGYRPVDVAGSGWLAEALDGSEQLLELHVVPAVVDARLSERAALLRDLRHEHLPQVLDVVELSPGRVGMVVEHCAGLSLAQVRGARAPLGDGEAATVAIPVAGALQALHRVGLTHGRVDASAVVVRPDGRPVLTDLCGALTRDDDPESDVRRLVATVLDQMPGADVQLVSDTAGGPSLHDALTALVGAPGATPDDVVAACYGATEPEPVRLPDAGALASCALTTVARGPVPETARGGTRRERRRGGRRRAVRWSVAGLLALGAAGAALVWFLPAGTPQPPPVTRAETPRPAAQHLDPDDPVAAAVALTRDRAGILGAGSTEDLAAVDVPDGPAFAADAALLAGLAGARLDGLTAQVQDARLVPEERRRDGTTDVVVTAITSAHARVPGDGGAVVAVAASPARTVVLGLRRTDDGWRVWDVVEP